MVSPVWHGCAAPQPSLPAVAASVTPWSEGSLIGRRYSTPHFDLISTIDDAEFEAALPGFSEAAYRRYAATITPSRPMAPRLTTDLLRSRSEWAGLAQRRLPARVETYSRIRNGGFTDNGVAFTFHMTRSSTLATLAHEGWHQYVDTRLDVPLPPWLNEGLACYHEAVEYASATPRFTPLRNTFRSGSLRTALQKGRLIPLSVLVATDAGRVIRAADAAATETYYAQAWALVTLLRHGAEGRFAEGFERMLGEIGAGTFAARVGAAALTGDGPATEAPFHAYFGVSTVELEPAYEQHILTLTGL